MGKNYFDIPSAKIKIVQPIKKLNLGLIKFADRSYKIGKVVEAYPTTLSLPLLSIWRNLLKFNYNQKLHEK